MLEITNGNIEYTTSHLRVEEITTYDKVIERLENVNTQLFYNIISSPDCNYERGYGKGRIREEYREMNAQDRFENILKKSIMHSNPKSFFVNKNDSGINSKDINEICSVSFTLANLEELPKHFKARGSEYGICFFHDFLQNKGIRLVTYLNGNSIETNERLIFNAPHLVEGYGKAYDMRWENEWRIKGDLKFSYSDIAFLIVPDDKYNYYLNWIYDKNVINDKGYAIPILTSSTYTSSLKHLLFLPKMDNSWRQVAVCGTTESIGFKIDPYTINDLTKAEFLAFEKKHSKELLCLSKNTLLNCYEERLTTNFFKFIKKIKSKSSSFEFNNYKHNSGEPYESERDLVHSLFTKLFYLLSPKNIEK